MARRIPRYDHEFGRQVSAAIALVERIELAMLNSKGLGNNRIRLSDVELSYELAYLRIFLGWERLLEKSLTRLICGYEHSGGRERLVVGASYLATIFDAEQALLNNRAYALWHNPQNVVTRARRWLDTSRFEIVLLSSQQRLEFFAAVRHRIAHEQDDARRKFDLATMSLSARRYPAARPGRFLRDWETRNPAPRRWLEAVGNELVSLGGQICS